MTPLPNSERQAFAIVEDALQTVHLAPAPPNFNATVMARLRTLPIRPHFRLAWADLATCAILASLGGMLLLVWEINRAGYWSHYLAAVLRLQFLNLWYPLQMLLPWEFALPGIALTLACLTCGAWLFASRRRSWQS